jgi:hypothetical protein
LRTTRVLFGVALVTGALLVMSSSAMAASTATLQCTNTALANPILGSPSCTTAPLTCPALHICAVKGTVGATDLVNIGPVGARIAIIRSNVLIDTAACAGTTRCSARTPVVTFVARSSPAPVFAHCRWNVASLAVLARVDCSETLTVF